MTDDLVTFLRRTLSENAQRQRSIRDTLLAGGVLQRLGADSTAVGRYEAKQVLEADALLTLLDKTIVPYLGTAGPMGRIAEQQLRIIGSPYRHDAGYHPEWAPDA